MNEQLLKQHGWIVECESPFEIRHKDGSFATGQAADLVLQGLNTDKRAIQLVAREGVLTEILNNYNFPTENHKKVIELIYEETLEEMEYLGLEEV